MWIVFIDINPDFDAIFEAVRNLDLKILYISENEKRAQSVKNITDHQLYIEKLKPDVVLKKLNEFSEFKSIAAVYALKDYLIPLAGFLNRQLNIKNKYYSQDLIWNTKNKFLMREKLKQLPYNPKYLIVKSIQDINLNEYPNGIVLKPILGYASIGVEKVNSTSALSAAYNRTQSVLSRISNAIHYDEFFLDGFEEKTEIDVKSDILVESCIIGTEVSVDVFVHTNECIVLGICSKSEMVPPFFEEVSYQMPSNLDQSNIDRLELAVSTIVKQLNMTDGVAHMEFILNSNEVILLDIGLRIGGSGLSHELVYLSTGINLAELTLKNLISNMNTSLNLKKDSNIGLLYLQQIRNGGKVKDIKSNNKLRYEPEFIKEQFFNSNGDILTGYPNYSGLPGYVLFKIRNRSENSFNRVSELLKKCSTEYEIEYE